jgi:hypothetical protein
MNSKKMDLSQWMTPNRKYLTVRKIANRWVAESLELVDGELVINKLCEVGSRMQAINAFKVAALEVFRG